jgi:hypothetical protein
MTLHRAQGVTPLCADCTYHIDNSCTFPQRPVAITCTLYQPVNAKNTLYEDAKTLYRIPWWRKYSGFLLLGVVLGVCLIVTLL